MEITTHSVAETYALGRRLGESAPAHFCIALTGPLGAGKTHLTRGITQGAQIADPTLVSSPTYVLLNIYPADSANPRSKTVYHIDAYRAHGPEDFAAIDLDELLAASGAGSSLVVIEWPERITPLLPSDRLDITIEPLDEQSRQFTLGATGPKAAEWLSTLSFSPQT